MSPSPVPGGEREALDAAADALAYPSPVTDAHERRAAAALAAGAPFLVRAAVDRALAEVERRITDPLLGTQDDHYEACSLVLAAGVVASYRRGQAER